jgi:hypothetical protein
MSTLQFILDAAEIRPVRPVCAACRINRFASKNFWYTIWWKSLSLMILNLTPFCASKIDDD